MGLRTPQSSGVGRVSPGTYTLLVYLTGILAVECRGAFEASRARVLRCLGPRQTSKGTVPNN